MNEWIITEIDKERARQDAQWGEQNHAPMKWLTILVEEAGEAAQAILQGNRRQCMVEIIHIIAVAVAWLECEWRGKLAPEEM